MNITNRISSEYIGYGLSFYVSALSLRKNLKDYCYILDSGSFFNPLQVIICYMYVVSYYMISINYAVLL